MSPLERLRLRHEYLKLVTDTLEKQQEEMRKISELRKQIEEQTKVVVKFKRNPKR